MFPVEVNLQVSALNVIYIKIIGSLSIFFQ